MYSQRHFKWIKSTILIALSLWPLMLQLGLSLFSQNSNFVGREFMTKFRHSPALTNPRTGKFIDSSSSERTFGIFCHWACCSIVGKSANLGNQKKIPSFLQQLPFQLPLPPIPQLPQLQDHRLGNISQEAMAMFHQIITQVTGGFGDQNSRQIINITHQIVILLEIVRKGVMPHLLSLLSRPLFYIRLTVSSGENICPWGCFHSLQMDKGIGEVGNGGGVGTGNGGGGMEGVWVLLFAVWTDKIMDVSFLPSFENNHEWDPFASVPNNIMDVIFFSSLKNRNHGCDLFASLTNKIVDVIFLHPLTNKIMDVIFLHPFKIKIMDVSFLHLLKKTITDVSFLHFCEILQNVTKFKMSASFSQEKE